MTVLVVGGGGREHALVWIIRKSDHVEQVYVAPGNAGSRRLATPVDLDTSNIVEIADFAQEVGVGLTVVGPELPLSLGIVDEFRERGLRCFGPTKAAAEIESSKVFTKEFLRRHDIPTAAFQVATSMETAESVLTSGEFGFPLVVKADGLAAGKGVIIARDLEEARTACREMLIDERFGVAGERVIIEEMLTGVELSFLALTDGKSVKPLVSSQDYKRVNDYDEGPNTGGMGAISPSPYLTKPLYETILERIIYPTIRGMESEGRPYRGVLYAGLMLTKSGPMVLEYNCRFGDPETQAILPRMKSDIIPYFVACIEGKLGELPPIEWKEEACCCVVASSGGYPGPYEKGIRIGGIPEAGGMERVVVFQAGTQLDADGNTVTSGGRVLNVTATDPSLKGAIELAYEAMGRIRFEGMHYRKDIGRIAATNLELPNSKTDEEAKENE